MVTNIYSKKASKFSVLGSFFSGVGGGDGVTGQRSRHQAVKPQRLFFQGTVLPKKSWPSTPPPKKTGGKRNTSVWFSKNIWNMKHLMFFLKKRWSFLWDILVSWRVNTFCSMDGVLKRSSKIDIRFESFKDEENNKPPSAESQFFFAKWPLQIPSANESALREWHKLPPPVRW